MCTSSMQGSLSLVVVKEMATVCQTQKSELRNVKLDSPLTKGEKDGKSKVEVSSGFAGKESFPFQKERIGM